MVEQFVRRALARAEEVGNRRAEALCAHALGAVLYLQGAWPESMAALRRGVDLSRSIGGTFGEVLGEQRLAVVETALGRHEAAHDRLRRALAAARPIAYADHSVGRILGSLAHNRFEAGDLAQATAYLAEGFAAQQQFGECPCCDALLYPVAVPIYLALGDLDQAERICRRAEESATVFGSQTWVAAARRARGLLAAHQGDWQVAAGSLEAALAMFEALGQPYDVARTLEALADLAAKAAPSLPHLNAAELRQRAAAIYAELGAAPDAERLRRGLA